MKNRIVALALGLLCLLGGGVSQAAGKIRSFEPDSFRQIAAEGKNKPLVVMVWALDCDYCLASFEALERARKERGLEIVTITTDRAADAQAMRLVRKKLASARLRSEVWAFGDATAERLRYAIDPKWRGELPRSYWFDGSGAMVAHSGLITSNLVDKLSKK